MSTINLTREQALAIRNNIAAWSQLDQLEQAAHKLSNSELYVRAQASLDWQLNWAEAYYDDDTDQIKFHNRR
jgi:hypothetical protein